MEEDGAQLPVATELQIRNLCEDLVACLTRILDPECPQAERAECDQKIELFKEASPHCLQCGFMLARETTSSVVRHFGLQLIENFVKYRWTELPDKEVFRLELLEFMKVNVLPSGQESNYVKEELAKITVETAKKMWPQVWKTFLSDLEELRQIGPTQEELILQIFRRLAEDIHEYNENLPAPRKRQMVAALNEEVETMFAFLVHSLEAPSSEHLLPLLLSTIAAFASWVEFDDLLLENCKLLGLLHNLINVEELKTAACECLIVILSRKSDLKRTADYRMKLLCLLTTEPIKAIMDASCKAHSMGVVEEQYIFLKRVCQVLVHLGTSQLGPLWNSDSFQRPEGFELYLEVVLEFTKHPSQLLCLTSVEVWKHFVNHNHIKEDPAFKAFLPRLLTVVRRKLIKLGNPSQSNDVSCEYSRIDFDAREYRNFFSLYRSVMSSLVSTLARLIPRTAAKEALEVVQGLTQRQLPDKSGSSMMSLLNLEWEAYITYVEQWTGRFKTNPQNKEVVKETGLDVLRQLLSLQSQDPVITAYQFRCLGTGITDFLEYDFHVLKTYLQKLFVTIRLIGKATEEMPSVMRKRIYMARNVIPSCFVRMCENHPGLLERFAEELYDQYRALNQEGLLYHGESTSFVEGFIVLSMKGKQATYRDDILRDVSQLAEEQISAVASIDSFGRYIGLDTTPDSPTYKKETKRKLHYVVHTIVVILKTMDCAAKSTDGPATSDGATVAGATQPYSDPQNCPAYKFIMPLLDKLVVPLTNILQLCLSVRSRHLFSDYFRGLHELHHAEKGAIQGNVTNQQSEYDTDELGLVQNNLTSLHELSLACIARAVKVFGVKHLHSIGFLEHATEAVLANAEALNSWRMRTVLRSFISSTVKSCQQEQEWDSSLLHLLYHSSRMVLNRLTTDWAVIMQRQSDTGADDSFADGSGQGETEVSQELLDELQTVALSREYATLLEVICVKKEECRSARPVRHPQSLPEDDVAMEDETEDAAVAVDVQEHQGQVPVEKWSLLCSLSPLAKSLLEHSAMCQLLFVSAFSGLEWKDTNTAFKCCNVAGLLFETAPVGMFSADDYEQLFRQALIGLQKHGIDGHVRSRLSILALMIYQSTMKDYPKMVDILTQLPGNSPKKVQAFNALLETLKPVPLKRKREMFKELLDGVVGKPIGEAFRKPVVVVDLPQMVSKRRAKEHTNLPLMSVASLFQAEVDFSQ